MRDEEVRDYVNRIDQLREFANKLNEIVKTIGDDIILQVNRPVSDEEFMQLQQQGRSNTVLEIIDSNGDKKREKPVARAELKVADVQPILGDLVTHAMMRSGEVYEYLVNEIK